MNLNKPVYTIILFWAIIVLFSIVGNETILKGNNIIYLKTVPIDPRDLFMGDYVILNYEIAQDVKEDYSFNNDVYVILDVDENKVASRKYVTTVKPNNKTQYIKGKIKHCSAFSGRRKCVNFGIENYYVKEGEGRKLENDLRKGALVEVVLENGGRAKVKGFKKD